MQQGVLVLRAQWNPVVRARAMWQPTLPRFTLHPPEGSVAVLTSTITGNRPRRAHRCPSCATVVVPPDEWYDPDAPG